jgi:hypothetical protein
MARYELHRRATPNAVARFNAVMQPVLDRVADRCAGQPVNDVREVLAVEWGANAGKALPEPYLTNWATRIGNGERVVLR